MLTFDPNYIIICNAGKESFGASLSKPHSRDDYEILSVHCYGIYVILYTCKYLHKLENYKYTVYGNSVYLAIASYVNVGCKLEEQLMPEKARSLVN